MIYLKCHVRLLRKNNDLCFMKACSTTFICFHWTNLQTALQKVSDVPVGFSVNPYKRKEPEKIFRFYNMCLINAPVGATLFKASMQKVFHLCFNQTMQQKYLIEVSGIAFSYVQRCTLHKVFRKDSECTTIFSL